MTQNLIKKTLKMWYDGLSSTIITVRREKENINLICNISVEYDS